MSELAGTWEKTRKTLSGVSGRCRWWSNCSAHWTTCHPSDGRAAWQGEGWRALLGD
jgi:hypothetical protein